jgi:hypothetical protein
MTEPAHTDRPVARPARGWFWPVLIVTFLAGHATMLTLVVLIASRDPSHAVEPDYYEKGIAWDALRASSLDPHTDGIEVAFQVAQPQRVLGKETITIEIRLPETGSDAPRQVRGMLFHHARAADRTLFDLADRDADSLVFEADLSREGNWEIQIQFAVGERLYAWSGMFYYARKRSE